MWKIWPICPYMGTHIRPYLLFFGQLSSFGNSLNYNLSIGVKKFRVRPLFSNFEFWGLKLAPKGAWLHAHHKGFGPRDPVKKFSHGIKLLGYVLSQNKVSKDFRPGPPLNSSRNFFDPMFIFWHFLDKQIPKNLNLNWYNFKRLIIFI